MRRALSITLAVGLLGLALAAMASPYPLQEVLDKVSAATLAKQKVVTTDDLLQAGATPKARQALAKTTGISLEQLTGWVNMSDLVRIKGVGPEMVRLFAAAKVHTVKQLRAQNPARLHKSVVAANGKTKITEKLPDEEQLTNWIEQAKKLKLVLR